jgi:glutamate 5-kinase
VATLMLTLRRRMSRGRRLVVKIGSALLVDRKTGLRQGWLSALALDVAEAKLRGTDVVLVSSGSIALGRKVLGLGDGALTLEQARRPRPSARSAWRAPMRRCWPRMASPPRRFW